MDELIMEPLKYYETYAKGAHRENIDGHFEDLVKQSGIDVEENRATVANYNEWVEKAKKVSSRISKYRFFMVLIIIFEVIAAFALALPIFSAIFSGSYELYDNDVPLGVLIILAVLYLAIAIILFIVLGKKILPVIKDSKALLEEDRKKAQEYLDMANAQMKPLLALLRADDTFRLIEKTFKGIKFEDYPSTENRLLRCVKYNYSTFDSDDITTVDVLSGSFNSNPFIYERQFYTEMGSETYNGSLRIEWVTYDSEGNKTNHSQTLHASVTKPKPYYFNRTFMGYGCDAGDDLEFYRLPKHAERKSDKSVARMVKHGGKKLEKKAAKAATQGGSFQEMANTEFDVLLGATDRTNEVQFRMLYTPLAQQSTVALLKSKTGYGDDFEFRKVGKYNLIMSEHAQNWKMRPSVSAYYSHDIDVTKNSFTSFNESYFKSVFFDFAPLLAIPAYHDNDGGINIADDSEIKEFMKLAEEQIRDSGRDADSDIQILGNHDYHVVESAINALGDKYFVTADTETPAILKASRTASYDDGTDEVLVSAYSYATEEMVDYIQVKGGDDNYHSVPVVWIKYLPRERQRYAEIKYVGKDSEDNVWNGFSVTLAD